MCTAPQIMQEIQAIDRQIEKHENGKITRHDMCFSFEEMHWYGLYVFVYAMWSLTIGVSVRYPLQDGNDYMVMGATVFVSLLVFTYLHLWVQVYAKSRRQKERLKEDKVRLCKELVEALRVESQARTGFHS